MSEIRSKSALNQITQLGIRILVLSLPQLLVLAELEDWNTIKGARIAGEKP